MNRRSKYCFDYCLPVACTNSRRTQSGYTEKVVRSKLENERRELNKELAARHTSDINSLYRRFGILDNNDERLWEDDDDCSDFEDGQEDTDSKAGNIAEGIRAGLDAWESRTKSIRELEIERAQYVEIVRQSMIDTNEF